MRKFKSSQNAHERLMFKHLNCIANQKGSYDEHFVKFNYHSRCIQEQEKNHKLLSEKDKKRIYDNVVIEFY